MKRRPWNQEDRQRWKDRNILKARTQPKKRRPPPNKGEWD